MAISKSKFIGLSSADPDTYGLPRDVRIKLNDKDRPAKQVLKYCCIEKKALSRRDQADACDRLSTRSTGWLTPPPPNEDLFAEKAEGEDGLEWRVE